jgi:hypothetical protein
VHRALEWEMHIVHVQQQERLLDYAQPVLSGKQMLLLTRFQECGELHDAGRTIAENARGFFKLSSCAYIFFTFWHDMNTRYPSTQTL